MLPTQADIQLTGICKNKACHEDGFYFDFTIFECLILKTHHLLKLYSLAPTHFNFFSSFNFQQ